MSFGHLIFAGLFAFSALSAACDCEGEKKSPPGAANTNSNGESMCEKKARTFFSCLTSALVRVADDILLGSNENKKEGDFKAIHDNATRLKEMFSQINNPKVAELDRRLENYFDGLAGYAEAVLHHENVSETACEWQKMADKLARTLACIIPSYVKSRPNFADALRAYTTLLREYIDALGLQTIDGFVTANELNCKVMDVGAEIGLAWGWLKVANVGCPCKRPSEKKWDWDFKQ